MSKSAVDQPASAVREHGESAAIKPAPPAVEIKNLTKRYGEKIVAVNKLNLTIQAGEIYGLLGPNGAGKTTTILMLLGLTEPTEGSVRVFGHNSTREPLAVKRIVGYLPDNVGFYEDLTGRENLRYTASLNGLSRKVADERIDFLLGRVGLKDAADRRSGEYSRGMRQRLGIADVLVKEPKVVFLDEPTSAIDPEGVAMVLELISKMSHDEGITVMLSSHLLHQVQQICHRVGIFVKGKLIADGSVAELAQKLSGNLFTVEVKATSNDAGLEQRLREIEGVVDVEPEGELVLVRAGRDVRADVARQIALDGGNLLHLRLRSAALEDVYLKYFRGS